MKPLIISFLAAILCLGNVSFAQDDGDEISIGKYRLLYSKILDEDRTLLVHLPEDYEISDKSYPVLYMLYGNHTATYYAETVSILEKYGSDGITPPMILVAVTNTDRYRDLLPLSRDGSKTGIDTFLAFFKTELIPFVEKNYRTKPFRALLGPQAGANFSLYTMLKEPGLFNAYFVNNPFRWDGGRDLLLKMAEEHLSTGHTLNSYMFITHDNSDELEIIGNEYIARLSVLVKTHQPKGFILKLNHLPESTDFISPLGISDGLRSYFSKYSFPGELDVHSLAEIENYYAALSEKYGYQVDIPGLILVLAGDKLNAKGETEAYIEILHYMIETNTGAENAHWRLSDLAYNKGNLELAKYHLEKMMELVKGDIGMIKARYDMIVKMLNKTENL